MQLSFMPPVPHGLGARRAALELAGRMGFEQPGVVHYERLTGRYTYFVSAAAAHRRPGELVAIDHFYVGKLRGTEGAIWQLSAIDVASSYAWADLASCENGNSTAQQTSKLTAESRTSSRPRAGA